ncbi:MAG: hypothetical protein JXA87_13995 [Thermoleophilia bacterium]|nr:hypothetical protein [Thermoleophilia bacterium]
MPSLRILFYSSSIGLGHVTRDIAIAEAIRKLSPSAEIDWLASSPAREYLLNAGERLHLQAARLSDATTEAETHMRRGRFNITLWAVAVRKTWAQDGRVALSIMAAGGYDALIGDEAYDLAMALTGGSAHLDRPCFILYDFLGLDSMSANPIEWIGAKAINKAWAREPDGHYRAVFLGELDDLPLTPFGRHGPPRREWAESNAAVVGHVLPFDLAALADRARLRAALGYGPEPLLVVSTGGTAAGAKLIARCLDAFPLARRDIPALRMLIVTGPRLSVPRRALRDGALPTGVEVRGYVPRLYEHFAVCDLAIVQGGGATTLELTALRRPFLFFPLRSHCEQTNYIAARQKRLGVGTRLNLERTSPAALSRHITSQIGREVHCPPIKLDGAQQTAKLVIEAAEVGSYTGDSSGM